MDYAGKSLAIEKYSNGLFTRAAIIPFLADLQAMRKITGFLAHSANQFCSWCWLKKEDIERLDYKVWPKRTGAEVQIQSKAWHDAATHRARQELEKANGVRWTPLHDLVYWDPVNHIVLGVMHNTLEGILEHHLRILWGIGVPESITGQINADADD